MSDLELLKLLGPILGYCLVCGSIIGFERIRRGSNAGMKTQVFICTGSALFTLCSLVLEKNAGNGDAGRLVAQIVSGVGFLGAGAIMAKDTKVIGLTTAAMIWIMAALGVMIGLGYGLPAVAVALSMVISIETLTAIENRYAKPSKPEVVKTLRKDGRHDGKSTDSNRNVG